MVCRSCHQILRSRLRQRLEELQRLRRRYHTSPCSYDVPCSDKLKSWYWDTEPPSEEQLDAASHFFDVHKPRKQWTAGEWRKQNQDTTGVLVPEIAFLGRSNVGKSTLLNQVLNAPGLNKVGPHPGKTKVMHAWGLSAHDTSTGGAIKGMKGQMDTKLILLDAPGYGHGSQGIWGSEIIKYLNRRKQLRRVFLLVDADHRVKSSDSVMLKMLEQHNISYQIVACKCDRIMPPSTREEKLQTAMAKMRQAMQPSSLQSGSSALGLGEIIAVSFDNISKDARHQAAASLRWAILKAAGLDEFAMSRYTETSAKKAGFGGDFTAQHAANVFGVDDGVESTTGASSEMKFDPQHAMVTPSEHEIIIAAQAANPGLNLDPQSPIRTYAEHENLETAQRFGTESNLDPQSPMQVILEQQNTRANPTSGFLSSEPNLSDWALPQWLQESKSTRPPLRRRKPAYRSVRRAMPPLKLSSTSLPLKSRSPSQQGVSAKPHIRQNLEDLLATAEQNRNTGTEHTPHPASKPATTSDTTKTPAAQSSASSTPTKPHIGRGLHDLLAMTESKKKPEYEPIQKTKARRSNRRG